MNGDIIIQSKCDKGKWGQACDYSWGRMNVVEIIKEKAPEPPATDEEIDAATIDLMCGESIQFGRCEIKAEVNCLYENIQAIGVETCSEPERLFRVSSENVCVKQRGKIKCAKPSHDNQDDCLSQCPGHCIQKDALWNCGAKIVEASPEPALIVDRPEEEGAA